MPHATRHSPPDRRATREHAASGRHELRRSQSSRRRWRRSNRHPVGHSTSTRSSTRSSRQRRRQSQRRQSPCWEPWLTRSQRSQRSQRKEGAGVVTLLGAASREELALCASSSSSGWLSYLVTLHTDSLHQHQLTCASARLCQAMRSSHSCRERRPVQRQRLLLGSCQRRHQYQHC